MKRILFVLLIPFLLTGCGNAQSTEKQQKKEEKTKAENAVKPKVDIKVNKVFDDKGNLIGYDSTYVWSYSNIQGDSVTVDADTVFSEFKPLFDEQFKGFAMPGFNNLMFNDSTFYHDFFTPDYFYDRWQQSLKESERMFREMDSLKNMFFKKNYPGLQKQNEK